MRVVLTETRIILCLYRHVARVGYVLYVQPALSVIPAAHVVMALVITIGINPVVLLFLFSA